MWKLSEPMNNSGGNSKKGGKKKQQRLPLDRYGRTIKAKEKCTKKR